VAKKKKGLGCLGTLVLVFLLFGFVITAMLGTVGYYAYKLYSNPQTFIVEHERLVRTFSDTLVEMFSQPKPMDIPIPDFDADAYNSFVQKVGGLQEVVNKPNARNIPITLSYSEQEIMSGFKQDFAAWDIQHYNLNFEQDKVHAQLAIKGEVLTPYIPQEVPKVFQKSLMGVEYLNVDMLVEVKYEGGLDLLKVSKMRLGDLNMSDFLLERFNQELRKKKPKLEEKLIESKKGSNLKPTEIVFAKDEVSLKGVWNPAN